MNTDTQQDNRTIIAPPISIGQAPAYPISQRPNSELKTQNSELPSDGRGLSVIIPAYNEGEAIGSVLEKIRRLKPAAEVIVVDDGSSDNTAEAALAHGARVVRHPYNKGNGAAVKSGLRAAGGEVVLLLDADGQHQPEDIERVLAGIGEYDLVVGARTMGTSRGLLRDLGNAFFNRLASYLVGRDIPDLTSGFRAMRHPLIMEFIHLLPNGYSYPTTSTLSFIKAGYNVQFVPIRARKASGKSQIKLVRDGTKFIVIILRIVTLFSPMKVFLPLSALIFLLGLSYGIWNFALHASHRIPNGVVLLLMSSVFVFLFGLISEQIAAMRFESTQRVLVERRPTSAGTGYELHLTDGAPAPTAILPEPEPAHPDEH
ncbi:MAG: glycosyltransferase family 2 protein [Chloroflexia bacterium]